MATAHIRPMPIIGPHNVAAPYAGRFASLIAAIVWWLRRLLCRLHGHAMMLSVEPGRMFLRCAYCGVESTGWRFEVSPALQRRRPAPARASAHGRRE